MAPNFLRQFEPPVGDAAHQVNAAAGAVVLVARVPTYVGPQPYTARSERSRETGRSRCPAPGLGFVAEADVWSVITLPRYESRAVERDLFRSSVEQLSQLLGQLRQLFYMRPVRVHQPLALQGSRKAVYVNESIGIEDVLGIERRFTSSSAEMGRRWPPILWCVISAPPGLERTMTLPCPRAAAGASSPTNVRDSPSAGNSANLTTTTPLPACDCKDTCVSICRSVWMTPVVALGSTLVLSDSGDSPVAEIRSDVATARSLARPEVVSANPRRADSTRPTTCRSSTPPRRPSLPPRRPPPPGVVAASRRRVMHSLPAAAQRRPALSSTGRGRRAVVRRGPDREACSTRAPSHAVSASTSA